MSIPAREKLVIALGGEGVQAKFYTHLELAPNLLTVAVDGIGPLKYPIGAKRAGELIALAAPASYGRRELTLTDPSVRDTWEVPKQLVHAQWAEGAFEAMLDKVREGLGLPSEGELSAEPHSVLVYEKDQFFLPHQDSEKHDEMIGTLVVTLPTRFQGGELIVEHGTVKEVSGSSPEMIGITAFYGDCRHEVTRVRSGYRITLTYNLLYRGDTQPSSTGGDPQVELLAQLLDEHFRTPSSNPYSSKPAEPPQRLAFLLDHEYTEKNLAWHRLKGEDAKDAELLRAAADAAGCRVMLGLTEIQETWDAYPTDEGDDYYDYDDEEFDEDDDEEEEAGGNADGSSEDDGEYELNDLIESSVGLVRWVDPETGESEKISLDISPREMCTRTENLQIKPYEQSYEGYMGNYGNTLDRWYRRAALIIWPQPLEFANRAQSSPGWGLKHLHASVRTGDLAQARELARTLAPFWRGAIDNEAPAAWLTDALTAARLLEDSEIAAMLLDPFGIHHLHASHAGPLAEVAEAYGVAWTEQLIDSWVRGTRSGEYSHTVYSNEWAERLPSLCDALYAAGEDGADVAAVLLARTWRAISPLIDGTLKYEESPSRRTESLARTGPNLASLLLAAERTQANSLCEVVFAYLAELPPHATPLLLTALRELAAGERGGAYDWVAEECSRRLRAELAAPTRAADDWSIILPDKDHCTLCQELAAFLISPSETTLTWPLVQRDREHIHSRIDDAELPVTHVTQRQGKPYKLVLTKTDALFTRERDRRATAQAVLDWIETSNQTDTDAHDD